MTIYKLSGSYDNAEESHSYCQLSFRTGAHEFYTIKILCVMYMYNFPIFSNPITCLKLWSVFRIRDILIRIRNLGSLHWITDPDPFCSFRQRFSRCQQKLSSFAYVLLPVEPFTSVFKDNKPLISHKTGEIKVFHNFLACWWKDPDPGGPKTYRSGWSKNLRILWVRIRNTGKSLANNLPVEWPLRSLAESSALPHLWAPSQPEIA